MRQAEQLLKDLKDYITESREGTGSRPSSFIPLEIHGDHMSIREAEIKGEDYFKVGLALIELGEIRLQRALKRNQKLLYEATFHEDMGR